jgi:hypothetical protein
VAGYCEWSNKRLDWKDTMKALKCTLVMFRYNPSLKNEDVMKRRWSACFTVWICAASVFLLSSTKLRLCFLLGMKMGQSVPKRRHIKFRRRGITQKKAYNIHNTAKVWNQESYVACRLCESCWPCLVLKLAFKGACLKFACYWIQWKQGKFYLFVTNLHTSAAQISTQMLTNTEFSRY